MDAFLEEMKTKGVGVASAVRPDEPIAFVNGRARVSRPLTDSEIAARGSGRDGSADPDREFFCLSVCCSFVFPGEENFISMNDLFF